MLTVEVYNGTTRVIDADRSLELARGVTFDTCYPGGLFASASFFCPRDVTRPWLVLAGYRVVIRWGVQAVWEGKIISFTDTINEGEAGTVVNAIGMWALILGHQQLNKRWYDNRIDEATWLYPVSRLDSNNRQNKASVSRGASTMTILPQTSRRWYASQYCYIEYKMPIGETVKQITFDYDFQPGVNNEEPPVELDITFMLYDPDNSAVIWSVSASGTGSVDETLVTPTQRLWLVWISNVEQEMAADEAYATVTSPVVRSELGDINLTEIAIDVINATDELADDYQLVGTNIFPLQPFVTAGAEFKDSILLRAAAFGDTNLAAWSVGLRESEIAGTMDGLPVLYAEAQPALTSFDYKVAIGSPNLQAPFSVIKDSNGIANWIIVKYKDVASDPTNISEITMTPDDDSSLKDQTSIDLHGRLEVPLDAGTCTATMALQYGQRYLAGHKDEQFYVSSPVAVKGYILGAAGEAIPVELIRAGMRLKIENYITDEAMVANAGLTFIVTQTSYNGDDRTCQLTVGKPDDTAVWLAQYQIGSGA